MATRMRARPDPPAAPARPADRRWGRRLERRLRHPYETRRIPVGRRFVTGALTAGRRIVPVHGLVTVDVTEARDRFAEFGRRETLTGFVLTCVARAAAMHPEVHAYRDWRGRLIVPNQVDIAALVEVASSDGPFPMAHLVRAADRRTPADISDELRHVKADPASVPAGRLLSHAAPWLARIPGAVALFYLAAARLPSMRAMAGTVAVSSIGMFGGGSGAAIGHPTISTLNIYVGGLSERPHVVEGEILVRDMLDLTVTVDHRIVDGAPAARFVADLRRLLERAAPTE